MLAAIENHRINAKSDNFDLRAADLMESMQKPVTWAGYKGLVIEMDTLRTQKARRLAQMYKDMFKEHPVASRLELIVTLKTALLEEDNSGVVMDVITMLDREAQLLIRDVNSKDLRNLRKRTNLMLFEYFKDPKQIGCASISKNEKCKPIKQYHFCRACVTLKPVNDFPFHTRVDGMLTCTSCYFLAKTDYVDYAPYRRMLRDVRREERRQKSLNSVAFVFTEVDMKYLVDVIWRGMSAVSEHKELLHFRIPRLWNDMDWAPWNCVLLTASETKAHRKQKNTELTYDPRFFVTCQLKHARALLYFKQLADVDKRTMAGGKWDLAHYVDKCCPR